MDKISILCVTQFIKKFNDTKNLFNLVQDVSSWLSGSVYILGELKTFNEVQKELMDLEFLGINLGDVAAKNKDNKALLIIPALSMTFTYISLIINNAINKKKGIKQPKPEDMEVPMPDMRVMNIMMPLMLGYVAYSIPQGVGLYWALSNFIGIIQTVVRRIILDPDKKKASQQLLVEKNEVKNVEYEVVEESANVETEKKEEKNTNSNNKKTSNGGQKHSNNSKGNHKKKK